MFLPTSISHRSNHHLPRATTSSFVDTRQEIMWACNSFTYTLFKLPCLLIINTSRPLSFKTLHWLFSKVTLYSLSHNWLMLNKFFFRLSTHKTLSIDVKIFVPIFPIMMILPFLFHLKVIVLSQLGTNETFLKIIKEFEYRVSSHHSLFQKTTEKP